MIIDDLRKLFNFVNLYITILKINFLIPII